MENDTINALEIRGLCKKYTDFALQNIDITLPRGCVMGFVGENGAGKTTTLKSILHLIHIDAGEIRVLGYHHEKDEKYIKEKIGVVLEDGGFLNTMDADTIDKLMKKAYQKWDSAQFMEYMKRFGIDQRKKIKEYSKGMRMKTAIAVALSHHAELLLLDEPTSGLDPIVRDEVLDLFYEFMQDETHAILLSSHITSDLDKIADYITFIHAGKVLLSEQHDELVDNYGILHCTQTQFDALNREAIRAARKTAFDWEVLARRDSVPENWRMEPVNIEQIMLLLTRGEFFS